MKIGIQLYSLRDAVAADYGGTLAKVAAIGYAGVELFGEFLPAAEIKQLCDGHGLEVVAHHFLLDQLEADVDACIERTLAVGASIVVCAWSQAQSEGGWAANADSLERVAGACAAKGLAFAYHNHQHELLETVDGVKAMDLIGARGPNVKFELDIAWLHVGNTDPAAYVAANAARTVLLHIKDVKLENGEWHTVELGQGSVPLEATVAAAKATASGWLLSEQDHSDDPWRSAARNFEWLKAHAA